MKYKCLKYEVYREGSYSLIPVREQDVLLIRKWRNEQINILRQKKILTESMQIQYFRDHVFPLLKEIHPRQIIFSFLKEKECIGYGGLTNIDWESKRTELSFLVDNLRAEKREIYVEDFSFYLKLIKQVVFDDLGFNRIFAETYDIRTLHISILEKSGFRFEGRMKEHVFIGDKFVDSVLHGILKKEYESER